MHVLSSGFTSVSCACYWHDYMNSFRIPLYNSDDWRNLDTLWLKKNGHYETWTICHWLGGTLLFFVFGACFIFTRSCSFWCTSGDRKYSLGGEGGVCCLIHCTATLASCSDRLQIVEKAIARCAQDMCAYILNPLPTETAILGELHQMFWKNSTKACSVQNLGHKESQE